MKIIFTSLVLTTLLVASCKQKGAVTSDQNTSTSTVMGNSKGEVSHQYRATGCATVIVITNDDGSTMTLIPKDKLDSKFDKNGLKISFNYHPLKMANPAGCSVGIPAEIKDVSVQ